MKTIINEFKYQMLKWKLRRSATRYAVKIALGRVTA
jgi:hypothetical protein